MTRILIVDDEPFVRRLIAATLRAADHDVLEAGDSAEALEILGRDPPDLLITDAVMPGLDGYGLIGRIRADPALETLPVILLSGLDLADDPLRLFLTGADERLDKGDATRQLNPLVRQLLDGTEAVSALPDPDSLVSSGIPGLDAWLGGGLAAGSNLALIGPAEANAVVGIAFLAAGLAGGEPCLWVELGPDLVGRRAQLNDLLPMASTLYEEQALLRVIDGPAWLGNDGGESIDQSNGIERMGPLVTEILAQSAEIGQSTEYQSGGRRLIGSADVLAPGISPDLARRFWRQLARSSGRYGGVVSVREIAEESPFATGLTAVDRRDLIESRVGSSAIQVRAIRNGGAEISDWIDVR